ncbi:MAG: metallopeptidase family protein [Acidobacteriota bacterium]
MNRARFERLVREALDALPDNLRARLDNVAVVVEDRPSRRQARILGEGGDRVLGLYEGEPLTERDARYSLAFPDRITIFQANVEAACRTEAEVREEVRKTVLHEIAHHFGIEDDRLDDLDY